VQGPQITSEKSDSGPEDDDDTCEEWERHEALHDDVQANRTIGRQVRTIGRLVRTIGRLVRTIRRQVRTIGRLVMTIGRQVRTIGRQVRTMNLLYLTLTLTLNFLSSSALTHKAFLASMKA
jgi:hypothetical protein